MYFRLLREVVDDLLVELLSNEWRKHKALSVLDVQSRIVLTKGAPSITEDEDLHDIWNRLLRKATYTRHRFD